MKREVIDTALVNEMSLGSSQPFSCIDLNSVGEQSSCDYGDPVTDFEASDLGTNT